MRSSFNLCFSLCALCALCGKSFSADRPDILIADFEGETYGDWKADGEAFGPGPAAGTLPNQMPVTGFLGKRLVNSFHGGDKSTGTLTSPSITVERKYLNFLVGGGGHPGKTCVDLVVEGKVVRTATGPNTEPGGSERLDWHTWDVSEFAGKSVVIRIVDAHTGGWGHINADHFVQGDTRKQAEPANRDLVILERYLHLPVKTGAAKRRIKLVACGATVREFEIELADGEPSFWAFADVSAFKGKTLRIEAAALPPGSKALDAITQGDDLKGEPVYREKGRPQFHFTARRGWLNDPNGLVYSAGEWHLFFQHNPFGWDWGNMHWGHAVSKDLFHWQELPEAIYPRTFGDWAFSGSAVVDRDNTTGWKTGPDEVLVAAYTSTGRGECIVFSRDRGRTWTEFDGNPVVRHRGRDPKLVWHAPTRKWVMAVYDEHAGKQWIAFYTSPDLKRWEFQSRIEGYFECPDLYELPAGEGRSKWVLSAADGRYAIGEFDGRVFHPDGEKRQVWYGDFYAAQTYDSAPGGRRVQIGWGRGVTFPGRPFNQQMTVPCDLSLHTTGDGPRLFAYPVKELSALRGKKVAAPAGDLNPGENPLAAVEGDLFDIEVEFDPGAAAAVGVTVRGTTVEYDAKAHRLTCGRHSASLTPAGATIRLRVLADAGSVEAFADGGRVAVSSAAARANTAPPVTLFARGGTARLASATAWELRSTWETKPSKPTSRTVRQIDGWTVRVDDRLLNAPNSEVGARALRFLEAKLADIKTVMPADKVARFQAVTVVLDLTHGDLGPMQYHPDAGWLKAHGYSTDLAKCVHLPRAADVASNRNTREQPWVILHELAHAYHDQVLGFDDPRVIAAYEKYKASGRGEKVLRHDGKRVRHYALTDHKEFFAEMTESYFGSNDFFPFNRAELKEAEPEVFDLMVHVWETPPAKGGP
jgi:fructan beta-fructosidase